MKYNWRIITRLSEHLKIYWSTYLYLSIFLLVSIFIGILAYALILNKPNSKETTKEPFAVKVFINENDTIIQALSSDIKELKNMIQKMQEDTLCVTITKGNK